ncbi:HNH endonuclease signature motif containing protein [Blastococcus sp. CCUG 61487]|uniref:HNH endonuclease signature motif containing protein n=1 Tax=Blastococcus sp. CCUG 61487 TaxID=1840703 RepID=UPI0010C02B9F|nr:HNH endonuclease signature motif containing protein [Blastococcus sp. CCUG 61487]TKJ28363.1 endonuclease [Blastococcus sp. CCUG 61487]
MCSTECVTPLECLTGALRALSGEDLKPLFGPAVLERANALLRARNVLEADLARTVREGELTQAPEHDGKASMASWLRGHHRLPQGAASQLVRTGRALEALPVLAAAAAAGAVSGEAVAAIAPVVSAENLAAARAQGVDLAAVDEALTQVAAGRPHAELRQVVGHYLARLDPDGPEPDPTEQRSLTISRDAKGMVIGRFVLDAIGGEKMQAAIESILQAARPAGDLRTRAQQAGDALVQLADNALAAGTLPTLRGHKPHVVVTIDLADLMDPHSGAGAGRTGFGGIISAAQARWLACDGNITRIVIGPEGQPLDVGRSKRLFPPHLRRAIEIRDQHCVFAGCDAPSHWCDIHHLVHWADGGDTSEENAGLLCERHHTKVHHGFQIVRDDAGRWHTYRPDGTEILLGIPEPFFIHA